MSERPTVVLVHGLAINRRAAKMLKGVPEALAAQGHTVHRTLVQGDGTLEELAERVWQQVEALPGPLVLLCHSMGGLQARTFLLDDRRAERLRAIATIGSPHQGTSLAQAVAPFGRAYRHLTPAARRAWNDTHQDEELRSARRHGVRLLSAVAATRRPRHAQFLVTVPLLSRLEGPNDGLVAAASQRFGEHAFETGLDHVACSATDGRPDEIALWSQLAACALADARPATGSA